MQYKKETKYKKSSEIEKIDKYCYGCSKQTKCTSLTKNICNLAFRSKKYYDNEYLPYDTVKHGKETIYKTSPKKRLLNSTVYYNSYELLYIKAPTGCNVDLCKNCMGEEFDDCYKYKMWVCKFIPGCVGIVKDMYEMKNVCTYYMEHVLTSEDE